MHGGDNEACERLLRCGRQGAEEERLERGGAVREEARRRRVCFLEVLCNREGVGDGHACRRVVDDGEQPRGASGLLGLVRALVYRIHRFLCPGTRSILSCTGCLSDLVRIWRLW